MVVTSNVHTHTSFCDGKDSAEVMAAAAAEKGFQCLGFSGHSYTPFDKSCCMSMEQTRAYREKISMLQEKYEGSMEILCGIEWDYYSVIDPCQWEYTIGSVHYVQSPLTGKYYAIDLCDSELEACIEEGFSGDVAAMIKAYYGNVVDMALTLRPTILGHFDLIRKLNRGNRFFDESSPIYKMITSQAMEQVVRTGTVLEINTGGMFRGYCDAPYPENSLLQLVKELGGSLILSSDAHEVSGLDYAFYEVLNQLRKLGFQEVLELRKNGFISTKL
ncbi:histidinol-phosphatase [Sinanaerobacter sp. ZZT-01]|uniref:histidinol-phosphatase n=1 Tax=Sinanaerobacter sp. ZZT-01 TaxID=3111540 RepID=UPI002D782D5D|nr:histidinol-phosphatase [Sinanaerobacter sp. ZZT-01]WRR92127.1 histidinol-phosphatase [Sinanaerobacter sp. ZZT-01]